MKKSSGLDKALIFVAIFVALFTISMIVTFWFFQDIPNVLVTAVFGATFAECGFCSYIWRSKAERDLLNKGDIEKEEEDESRITENFDRTGTDSNGFSTVIGSNTIYKE